MNSAKELIREKMCIQDVIGSYITLVPAGKNYKACCPFHIEKTPSFQVSTERQMFYCFGCKKGGDIFSFIQEIERVDFKEALKILAEKAGINIHQSTELVKELQEKKQLIQIHEYATRFYQLCLSRHQFAMKYLESRTVNIETIKRWRIGYAPDDFQALTTILQKKGFTDHEIIQSGLVGRTNNGRLYDRFRGRIMFPITDSQGVVIAFSGRLLPGIEKINTHSGKYINSPETSIYHKSSALFGFSYSKKTISEQQTVIIVEGQFDAILLYQSGYTNVIALSGTAATDKHMEQVARFAQKIIIATDGDSAGIASAHKIAMLGYRFNIDISLIIIPQGKDPADIITTNSKEWESIIQNEKDYITFHGEITVSLSLRERVISIEQHLFPLLAEMQNHVHRDSKLQSIANQLQVSLESIRNEFQKFIKNYHSKETLQNNFLESSFVKPAIKNELKNSLDIQISELIIIYNLFQKETEFWFKKHTSALTLIKSNTHQSISEQERVTAQIHYELLDQASWNITLDTLWLRIQQLQIDENILSIRNTIVHTTPDDKTIHDLQKQLLTLQSQREELVRSLAE